MSPLQVKNYFRYPISIEEVEDVLFWMLDREYVRSLDGKFRISKSIMTTQDEVPNSSHRQMHIDAFRLAEQSLANDAIEDREFQTYLFTMDRSRLAELKSEIKKLVWRMIGEYETELDASTVVQLHFHLFEVIEKWETEKS